MNDTSHGGARLLPSRRGRTAAVAALVLLCTCISLFAALCVLARTSTVFFPNTAVEGVAIGGLSADDAAKTVCAQILERKFFLTAADGEAIPFTTAQTGAATEESITAAVESLYRSQHEGHPLRGGWTYLKHLLGRGRISGAVVWSQTAVEQAAADMKKELDRDALDAAYTLTEEGISFTLPREGRRVDEAALAATLLDLISSPAGGVDTAPLGETVLPAKAMTARELYNAVHAQKQNAVYDPASDTILPESVGADFDIPTAEALLASAAPGKTVLIPAVIDFPTVTAAQLKALLFRDVLGECTTTVSGTSGRKTNVRLSAEKLNGYTMNTGDVFSYNGVVGKRTAEAGFQSAPAYLYGETVNEIGGGICQTSSTLYYACLKSDLKIVERTAHRYVPAYIDWGMDATVSWGGPDYRFANDTDYPIRIETVYEKDRLTVRILGTNIDGTYAKMTSKTLSKTDWKTVYEEDPTLGVGEEKVKTTPYTGYLVKSYRHIYSAEGKLLSSAEEAKSNYRARDQVILRGPAPAEDPLPPAAEEQPAPPPDDGTQEGAQEGGAAQGPSSPAPEQPPAAEEAP